MKLELNDQERIAVGRSLAERKARLIEKAGDTTQPRAAKRSGLLELKVITSVLRKMRLANGAKRNAKAERAPLFLGPSNSTIGRVIDQLFNSILEVNAQRSQARTKEERDHLDQKIPELQMLRARQNRR